MLGSWKKGGCLVALLVLGACSEQQRDVPTGPAFAKGGGGSVLDCDFQPIHGFIVDYFAGSQQSKINALVSSMEGTSDLAVRRPFGYEIMDSIGTRSRSASLSASELLAGENLTKSLIKCMFDATNTTEFPGFPDADVYRFHLALNESAGGAYYVRRSTQNDSLPVLGVQGSGPTANTLSGIAPPLDLSATPDSSLNWKGILTESVLIYGWPEASPAGSFEWALIRPNTTFTPGATAALCTSAFDPNTLVEESNIGDLAWEGNGAYICGATPSLTILESGWGARSLARRLTRWGTSLLTPEPAFAAALASGGTGTIKTLKSKLSKDAVTGAITLSVAIKPKAVEKENVAFTVQILATVNGTGVNGVCALLSGFGNNGQPAQLLGTSNCDTPGPKQLARETETTFLNAGVPCVPSSSTPNCKPHSGYATFLVTVPSPGAMSISVTGVESGDDNLTLGITPTSIAKFNVKP